MSSGEEPAGYPSTSHSYFNDQSEESVPDIRGPSCRQRGQQQRNPSRLPPRPLSGRVRTTNLCPACPVFPERNPGAACDPLDFFGRSLAETLA